MLIGGLAGSALAASRMLLDLQFKPPLHVSADFGRGLWPTIGRGMVQFAPASYWAFFYLALLTLTTILVRRRWIAVTTTGLVLFLLSAPWSASEVCSEIITIAFLLTILLCFELVGLMASLFVWGALSGIPPLDLTRWYGGLAGLGLFLALAPLVFGFYTSQWRHSTVLDTLRLKESDNL